MDSFEKWQVINGLIQSASLLATFLGALYIGFKQNELNEFSIEKNINPL